MTTQHNDTPHNECERCDGTGQRFPTSGGEAYTCPKCAGRGWTGQPVNDSQRLQAAEKKASELQQQLTQAEGSATAKAYREIAAMLLNGEMSPGDLATHLMKQANRLSDSQ